MKKPGKRIFLLGALVLIGAVIAIFVTVMNNQGTISGTVHYNPGSCRDKGLGCYESYITLGNKRVCALDGAYAMKRNNQRVRINAIVHEEAGTPLCTIIMK